MHRPVKGMLDLPMPMTIQVIIAHASEDGNCPGLESFMELRQPNVRMFYRVKLREHSGALPSNLPADMFRRTEGYRLADSRSGPCS